MLSLALAWAEVLGAQDIFIGVNALDYSGYPDCRGEYVKAFQEMANLATKSAVEGQKITIHAPLIDMTKAEIIALGTSWTCLTGQRFHVIRQITEGRACGHCDSCRLRREGFLKAAVQDPTRYID
jgi:7-cyano-7-deazaguanine synthase